MHCCQDELLTSCSVNRSLLLPRYIDFSSARYDGSHRLSFSAVGWSYSVEERMSCASFASCFAPAEMRPHVLYQVWAQPPRIDYPMGVLRGREGRAEAQPAADMA